MNDTPGMSGCAFFLPHSDREAVETIADERGVQISDVFREAIRDHLDRQNDGRVAAGSAT